MSGSQKLMKEVWCIEKKWRRCQEQPIRLQLSFKNGPLKNESWNLISVLWTTAPLSFRTSFDHSPLHCLYYGSGMSVRRSIHNNGHLYIKV